MAEQVGKQEKELQTYYEQGERSLAPARDIPHEALVAIERADEQAIVEVITEAAVRPYFTYSYPIKTKEGLKEIIGISTDGAKEIARHLGNIRVSPDIKLQERDNYFYAVVSVTDLVRNVTLIGVGRQSKYILGEGMLPTERIDETAYVKAISKAQRNGILSVAPQQALVQIMETLDPKTRKKLTPAKAPATKPLATQGPIQARVAQPVDSFIEQHLKELRQRLHSRASSMLGKDAYETIIRPKIKEHFNLDSSTLLNEEQLKQAMGWIDEEVDARGVATESDIRPLIKQMKAQGMDDSEIRDRLYKITKKKGGWTKEDIERVRAELNRPEEEDPEVAKFLKEFSGGQGEEESQ